MHVIAILFVNLLFLLFILLINNINVLCFIALIITIEYFLLRNITIKGLIIILLVQLPIAISILIVGYFSHKLSASINIFLRIILINYLSMIFLNSLNLKELLLFAMQKKILTPFNGYLLLNIKNNFYYLLKKFRTIYQEESIRYQKHNYLNLVYLLFLVAIRYSHFISINLSTRTFNPNKTYFYVIQKWKIRDSIFIIFNILVLIGGIIYINNF